MTPSRLRSGSKVVAARGYARGRVALLVSDQHGKIFALVARRLAREAAGGWLQFPDGVPVASTESPADLDESCSASDFLELCAVREDVLVDIEDLPSGLPVPPIKALGTRIVKLDGEEPREARVTAIYASLRVGSGDRIVSVSDAIEIEPTDPKSFYSADNGGALLLGEDSTPLGVIIAGDEQRYFAAPLHPWLKERGLEPLQAEIARRHNQHLLMPVFAWVDIEIRNEEFVQAMFVHEPVPAEKVIRLAERVEQFGQEHRRSPLAQMAL